MTPRQKYIRLLYAAYDAHVTVDYCDLKSEDEKSATDFAGLVIAAEDADEALLEHIKEHGDACLNS